MNAVMVVAKSAKLLERVTFWVQRLDRSDTGGNALRTYRLKYAGRTGVRATSSSPRSATTSRSTT